MTNSMDLFEMVAARKLTSEDAVDIMMMEDYLNHPWKYLIDDVASFLINILYAI